MPAPASDTTDWIRLLHTAGVGNQTARRLLQAFGAPAQIFASDHASLRQVVSSKIASALLAAPDAETTALLERSTQWLQQEGNHLLTLDHPQYPPQLLNIADPPLLLYAKGRLELLHRPALAIVGSRNASQQGQVDAEKFAAALGAAGLTIISGLAGGIDSAAHRGALTTSAGTVAVIGTGADIVYPAKNLQLAHQIADHGCLLSEYALGTAALAHNFPRRNRIISGLSMGVLVVEAALESGSLITARTALDQGREVFAIPGSIHSSLAKGCHQLLKQGAKLVECAQDVLEELPLATHLPSVSRATPAPGQRKGLLEELDFNPVDADTLAGRSGLSVAQLAEQLLQLELEGCVERLPDGRYQRLQA